MILQGISGQKYDLKEPQFAEGGEGRIYHVNGHPDLVAKLYKAGVGDSNREQKLLKMYKSPPDKSVLDQIVWPVDILYDGSRFMGFLMRKFDFNEDLNVIYEYGSAAKYPDMPWGNKVRIAKNLCAVLHAVHEAGHIVGDFNPKNVSVNPNTGYVIFLDTDSYHITDANNTYRCKVGMPEFIPHEIQPKLRIGLDSAPLPTYTVESDNFTLAVHIFQLLMNGVHPYACSILPSMVSLMMPNTAESILNGETPFFKSIHGKQIPKFAPPISILPKDIQKLFEKAFVEGHKNPSNRPDAKTWFFALEKLEKSIKKCKNTDHHEYYDSLSKCPWCSADSNYSAAVSKAGKISQTPFAAPFTAKKRSGASGSTTVRTKTVTHTGGSNKSYFSGIANIIKSLLGHTKRLVIILAVLSFLGAVFTFFIFPKYIYPELPDNNFNTPEIVQAYSGSYSCDEGDGDAIINITSCDKDGKIEGTFEFFNNNNYGKYEIDGNITEKKRSGDLKMNIRFEKWIFEAKDYSPIGEMNISVTDDCNSFSCPSYSIKWSAGENEEHYIKTADDFKKLNNSSSIYLLKNDIDLSGVEWTPIDEFSGTLFGNGFSVNNFSLSLSGENIGFFSVLKGKIINLNFGSASVEAADASKNVGIVCGKLEGSVVGINVSGSINAPKADNVGSIAGLATSYGVFREIKNTAAVNGNSNVGGIFGYFINERESVDFIGLENSGKITGNGNNIGGIVGYGKVYDSVYKPVFTLSDCKNTGNIKGTYHVGGIAGYACSSHDGVIKNCTSSAVLDASAYVGGIAGEAENISVESCKNDGSTINITGYIQNESLKCSYVGGFVGKGERVADLVNAVSLDCTSGGYYVGGIIGYIQMNCSSAPMKNLTNSADIKGTQYVGGIFGYISEDRDSVIFENLVNSGKVEGSKNDIGGIAGHCYVYDGVYHPTLTFSSCENSGAVNGQQTVGGIVGYSCSSHDGLISDCKNTSEISGNAYVGCIAGIAESILVDKCENDNSTLKINGYKQDGSDKFAYVGGFVGKGSKISNCKNTVNVDCSLSGAYVGGIMGYCDISCGDTTFTGLENTADIEGLSRVGGIFGYISEGRYSIIFEGLKNSGSVFCEENFVGGIIGYFHVSDGVYHPRLTISNCSNTGNIEGRDYVGGIAGSSLSSHDGLIDNCSVSAKISGRAYVGGIAGEAVGIAVDKCNNSGSSVLLSGYLLKESKKYSYAGGYVGFGEKITNCVNEISINGDGCGSYIGGIMGYSEIGCNDTLFTGLVNKGDIIADAYAGGLFGAVKSGRYSIIFDGLRNSGNITTNSEYAGGIVGNFYNYNGIHHPQFNLDNCVNEGFVYGLKFVGGIGGYAAASGGSVKNCRSEGSVFGIEEIGPIFGKSEGVTVP